MMLVRTGCIEDSVAMYLVGDVISIIIHVL